MSSWQELPSSNAKFVKAKINIRLHKLQLNEIKYILPALLSVSAVWRSAVASHWRNWYRTAQNRSSQISQIRRCPGSQYCSLVCLSPLLHSLSGNEVKLRSRVGLPKELGNKSGIKVHIVFNYPLVGIPKLQIVWCPLILLTKTDN